MSYYTLPTAGTATASSATCVSTRAASTVPPSPPPSISQSVASLGSEPRELQPFVNDEATNRVADWVAGTAGEVLEDPPSQPQWAIDLVYDVPRFLGLKFDSIVQFDDFGALATIETIDPDSDEDLTYASSRSNTCIHLTIR